MKEEKYNEKANILNDSQTRSITDLDNEDIEVCPKVSLYNGSAIAEAVAVTYGPPPFIEQSLSTNIDDEVFPESIDEDMIIDINSDMYGAPLPDDFYVADLDSFDLSVESELLQAEETESEKKDNEPHKGDDLLIL